MPRTKRIYLFEGQAFFGMYVLMPLIIGIAMLWWMLSLSSARPGPLPPYLWAFPFISMAIWLGIHYFMAGRHLVGLADYDRYIAKSCAGLRRLRPQDRRIRREFRLVSIHLDEIGAAPAGREISLPATWLKIAWLADGDEFERIVARSGDDGVISLSWQMPGVPDPFVLRFPILGD